jgi:hypothetical protein
VKAGRLQLGYPSGTYSGARWLAPTRAYTGNGRTRRDIYARLDVVFRHPDGRRS